MKPKEQAVTKKQFPVLITMYHRPENVERLISSLKDEQPKKIYVSSDGPATEEHKALVGKCRNEIEKIDWPCEVVKLYRSENAGLYSSFAESLDFVLSENEGAVVLEDDCIPKSAFFEYLRFVHSFHENDERVPIYCGYNPIGRTPFLFLESTPYSLSKRFRSWGFYIKADFWRDIRTLPIVSPMPLSSCIRDSISVPGIFSKLFKLRMLLMLRRTIGFGDIYINHFLIEKALFVTIPTENLVENIGDGESATHTTQLPDIKLSSNNKISFQDHPKREAKVLNRVDVLDGWFLFLWGLKRLTFKLSGSR